MIVGQRDRKACREHVRQQTRNGSLTSTMHSHKPLTLHDQSCSLGWCVKITFLPCDSLEVHSYELRVRGGVIKSTDNLVTGLNGTNARWGACQN